MGPALWVGLGLNRQLCNRRSCSRYQDQLDLNAANVDAAWLAETRMVPEHQGWKTTVSRLKADRRRLLLHLSQWQRGAGVYFHPSFICIVLYRISRHFFQTGHSLLARLLGQLNEL